MRKTPTANITLFLEGGKKKIKVDMVCADDFMKAKKSLMEARERIRELEQELAVYKAKMVMSSIKRGNLDV